MVCSCHANPSTEESIEQIVALGRFAASHCRIILAQDYYPFEPEVGAGSGELAAVVRLDNRAQHRGIATLSGGLGEGEFEIAGLVAAKGQARQVIALDPDPRSSEFGAELGTELKRCRQVGKAVSGQRINRVLNRLQVHGLISLIGDPKLSKRTGGCPLSR